MNYSKWSIPVKIGENIHKDRFYSHGKAVILSKESRFLQL